MPRRSTLQRSTAGRRTGGQRRIVVTFYDPDQRESLSITVYGGVLKQIAQDVQDRLRRFFKTTRLDDRRHKRR